MLQSDGKKKRLTNRTKLSVILPNTLHGMHLHLDFLSRPQFGKHDIRISWRRWVIRVHYSLFALGVPLKVRREDF